MKKLWKQEWKYHIGFTVLATILLVIICDVQYAIVEWQSFWQIAIDNANNNTMYLLTVLDLGNSMANAIIYEFFVSVLTVITITLLVKKGLIYWQENNLCGREFFQSLPIRTSQRYRFHVYMDMVMIVVPIVIYTLYEYMKVKEYLEGTHQIETSWLLSSYCGIAITTISFIIMLLGLLYLMDILFTNGYMKLVGFGGCYMMTFLSLNSLFGWFPFNRVMQTVYGFFTLNSVGGNRYVSTEAYGYTWSSDVQRYYWLHDNLNAPVKVKGEWMDYAAVKLHAGDNMEWISEWNRLFDFSNPSSYLFQVAGYLLIGLGMIGIVFYLLKKKDVSKEGFYFEGGRYLISGAVAITVFLMITAWNDKVLQIICNLGASVIIFFFLEHFMNPNRKKGFLRRLSKGESSKG